MTKNWFYGPYQFAYGLWRRMRIVVLIDKFLAPYPQPGTKRRCLIILGRSSLASLLELLETIEIESISFKFSVLLAFFFLFNLPSGHVSTQSTSLPSPLNPSVFHLIFQFLSHSWKHSVSFIRFRTRHDMFRQSILPDESLLILSLYVLRSLTATLNAAFHRSRK